MGESLERIWIDTDDVAGAQRRGVGSYYVCPAPDDASNREVEYVPASLACLHSCTPEERAVIHAANRWHAEINRTRSTSAIHVRLEDFEQELFAAVSRMLAVGDKPKEHQ